MDRVTKRFLLKIGKGLAMLTYMIGSLAVGGFAAYLLGYDPGRGILLGGFVFMIAPLVFLLIRDVYRDAKREIEWENRKLMMNIKGE
jgi:hypothetical protein